MIHFAQNPCGRDVNNFVRTSYDWDSANPQKDSMAVFLMAQIAFLRDEIEIKNNITDCLLTLKNQSSMTHNFLLITHNKLKKINKNVVDKNGDNDDACGLSTIDTE